MLLTRKQCLLASGLLSAYRHEHACSEQKPAADTAQNDTGPTDYPRPAAPGEQPPHEHHQHEEEQPKRDKHHGLSNEERRALAAQHRRGEQTRPSREMMGGGKTGGMRIAQPATKGLGV